MRAEALERRGTVKALIYINDHPECLQEEIINGRAELQICGTNAIVDVIRRLADAGLIERGDGHLPHHARPMKVTARGQRIVEVFREVEE